MHHVILLCLFLSFSTASAQGPDANAKRINARSAAQQIKRCEDGVAYACYDYGVTLKMSNSKKKKREGEKYVRRACTLAYQPACAESRSATVANKKVTTDSKGEAAKTKSCFDAKAAELKAGENGSQQLGSVAKGSALDKAGFLPGDVIKSVNGEAIDSPEKLQEVIEDSDGASEIVVERRGASVNLNLPCD